MSKEHEAYRFFILIYTVIIANFAVGITEGATYYAWFLTSVIILLLLLIS